MFSRMCNPSCDCGKYVEIWNNVFMEFYKDKNGYTKIKTTKCRYRSWTRKNDDAITRKKETPFEIEIFAPVMKELEKLQKVDNIQSRRIVTEHLRSSMMIINDGGRPSNVDRGYILRRLLRRMTRHMNKLEIDLSQLENIIDISIDSLKRIISRT